MKNFNYLAISSLFIFGIISIACDKVDDPYAHLDDVISEYGDPAYNDTSWNDTAFSSRMIMIEDFTGHKCPNCPKATDIGNILLGLYPENLIITALHNSNNFSEYDPPEFPGDFETETGENLRSAFDLNSFPIGMINRHDFSGNGQRGVTIDLWEDYVNQLLADNSYMNPSIDLDYKMVYNTEIRLLRIFPKVTVQKNISGEVFLAAYVLENGIVSPQEDNRVNPPIIEDYVHEHMLRAGFEQNDVGVSIFETPSSGAIYQNDSIATADIILEDEWIADSLDVVVYAYNWDTKEILQASKTKLIAE